MNELSPHQTSQLRKQTYQEQAAIESAPETCAISTKFKSSQVGAKHNNQDSSRKSRHNNSIGGVAINDLIEQTK